MKIYVICSLLSKTSKLWKYAHVLSKCIQKNMEKQQMLQVIIFR